MLRGTVAFPKEMMFEVKDGEVVVLQTDRGRDTNRSRKASMWQSLAVSGGMDGPQEGCRVSAA